jgi:hypothetical protein
VNTNDPRAIEALERSMAIGRELGARELTDTYVSGLYAEAAAWLIPALITAGRIDDAKAVGADAAAVADGILAQRPSDRQALFAQGLIQSSLGDAATSNLRPHEAIPYHLRAVVVQQTLVDFDPGNKINHNNLASVLWTLAGTYWSIGAVDDAFAALDSANTSLAIAGEGGAGLRLSQNRLLSATAEALANAGQLDKARARAGEMEILVAALRASEPEGSLTPQRAEVRLRMTQAQNARAEGDTRRAATLSGEAALIAQEIVIPEGQHTFWRSSLRYESNRQKAEFDLRLGDYAAAEQSARAAKAAKEQWPIEPVTDGRQQAELSTLLALALSGQGRVADAKAVIDPAVKFSRELAARNHGDELQKLELAAALYVQALTDPARRASLLAESRGLIASVPDQMKALESVRFWAERVARAAH